MLYSSLLAHSLIISSNNLISDNILSLFISSLKKESVVERTANFSGINDKHNSISVRFTRLLT